MGLFRRKERPGAVALASAPGAAAWQVDELLGIAEGHRFQRELAAGRWEEFHAFLEAITDWDVRDFFVYRLSDLEDRPAWMQEWVDERPGSSLPRLFRGTHGVRWAWRARGAGRAHMVKDDVWPVFHKRLVEADRDLCRAAELDPSDPSPLARSIWVAMGLSLGQQEVRRRFAAVEERHHLNWTGVYSMVQALAGKWAGSHEAMFEFARWVHAEAPEGHHGHTAIALAHIERWLATPGDCRADYFRTGDVKAEVDRAADRSVRSQAWVDGPLAPGYLNVFAMCQHLAGDYRAQAELMDRIGEQVTRVPWQFLGDPVPAYVRAREDASRRVAGRGPDGRAGR